MTQLLSPNNQLQGYWQSRSQDAITLITTILNRFDTNYIDQVNLSSEKYQQVELKLQDIKLSLLELIFNNKNISDAEIINLSRFFDKNLDNIVDPSLDIIDNNLKKEFEQGGKFYGYDKDPQFIAGIIQIHSITGLPINELAKIFLDQGLTGKEPYFLTNATWSPSLQKHTNIHDFLSTLVLSKDPVTANLGKSYLEKIYGTSSIELSAVVVVYYAIIDAPSQPLTGTGVIGSAVGGQIASYFADDTFANQLLAKSIGSTVTGWIGDAVEQFFVDKQSIEILALPNTFFANFISTVISFGSDELSQSIIKALDLDDPLEQIFASTLISQSASYSVAVAVAQVAPETAIAYFGMPGYLNQARQPILDYSFETFGINLLNAFGGALGSYAGGELSNQILNTDSREAQLGGSLGSTIGSIIGQTLIPIPGVGAAVGAALGNLYGSTIGYLMDEVPILGYILGREFALLIELLDNVIDEDFPRAAYVVNIVDGEFVTKFAYELDKGNTEIARQMGEAAKDILNFFAGTVGGQLVSADNVYYGHYIKQSIYQPQDGVPASSSFGKRVGFDNPQAAIEAGAVYQLTKTQIEGGDRYIKRLLANLTAARGTLEELNQNFQIAKEYGVYQDNPALYQEYINNLAANSLQDADKRIIDLRSHPWDRFVPDELNDALIKKVAANLSPTTITLSLQGNDLIINGEKIENWVKTQPENKIQFLRFADGSTYTINVDKDNKVTLKVYEKDLTIRDFSLGVLPSQVSLSLSGNNLIINGETITNWLANTETITVNGKPIINVQIVTHGDNNKNNTKERLDPTFRTSN